MRVEDCKGKLRVGMRVRTNGGGLSGSIEDFLEGYIGEITDYCFYLWQNERAGGYGAKRPSSKGYEYSWAVDFSNKWAEITILSKPMDITKAKYAIQYERDEDPTEYFKNLKDAENRIVKLLEDFDVKKDRIYLYRVADLKRVERPVSYKLVDVK